MDQILQILIQNGYVDETGAKFGMQTLDAHLTALFKAGLIANEELITKSQDPDSVVQKLKEEGYGA